MRPDSPDYLKRKRFFDSLVTIYGRKPVLEALQSGLPCYRLHLAKSNRAADIIDDIVQLAEHNDIEVVYHSREALSRISKNGKQDQGVAADINCPGHMHLEDYLNRQHSNSHRLVALNGITNPQNLGMIIRSACAGNIDGILIPRKGCAPLSPLVIKASAGTLFKAHIIKCETLKEALQQFKEIGFSVCALSSRATESLFEHKPQGPIVYVLGNESEGISADIFKLADRQLMIPMRNNVESLNVAITAALIAFSNSL